MKKSVSVILALGLIVASLTACGSSSADTAQTAAAQTAAASSGESSTAPVQERVWKFSTTRAEGTDNDMMAHAFKDSMEKSIDGLTIDIYPNNQLGDYTVVQEAVGLGDIQLSLASMSNGVDQTLSVQIAPYLVSNWDEAKKFYNSTDGIIYKYIEERLDLQGIHLLAVMPKYFGSIMSTKPLTNADDPTASKGAKIRVPMMNSFEKFASAIGFQTTPLPISDTFTALQTGVIEGVCGGGTESYHSDYGELTKYVYKYRTHMENHWLYMSNDAWNSLSADEQATVTEIAKDWENKAYDLAMENETKYEELFTEEGAEIIEFDDATIQKFADYVHENVWPEIGDEYGDIWNDIMAQLD